jgi:hypothetical protein
MAKTPAVAGGDQYPPVKQRPKPPARRQRGGFADIHQAAVASAIGRGRCGRTVIAINTPAMPIADDAT